jgi:hypothetical protein
MPMKCLYTLFKGSSMSETNAAGNLKIANLLVGQNYLRRTDVIENMIKFVRDGGFWTKEAIEEWGKQNACTDNKPIYISEFEDGIQFVHDGHHHLVSTFIGGREYLREDEYRLKPWKYEDYRKVDFASGFVTPFDVMTECRLSDFSAWKLKIVAMAKASEAMALETITQESYLYCEPRINNRIMQLAAEYQKLHKPKPKKGIIKASGIKRTALGFELGQEAANALNLQKAQDALGPDRPIDVDKVNAMADKFKETFLRPHPPHNLAELADEKNRQRKEETPPEPKKDEEEGDGDVMAAA